MPPPSPAPGTRKELSGGALEYCRPSIGPVRVTKNEAVERLKKTAHIARKARDGQGMAEVRRILKMALVSLKAGNFEDMVRHSEEVLDILRGALPAP